MTRSDMPAQETNQITSDHLFFERLKLLIIMSKAAIQGYPIGDIRAEAIRQNAYFIFYQSLDRSYSDRNGKGADWKNTDTHLFYQRTQLLAVMALNLAEGKLAGSYRLSAMAANIDCICNHLREQFHPADAPILKVA